jgi:4-hydroxy-3-polyprenylbenzoate decarboxylase
MKRICLAITGATGSVYAVTLLERLVRRGDVAVDLVVSPWGERVLLEETGRDLDGHLARFPDGSVRVHAHDDLAAPLSSGSVPLDAMAIVPCTMGTLSSIASGLASNLVERAASVCLKERRRLVLVARETPLSSIHLENMLKLSNAGAIILPPEPAFYTHPATVEEIVSTTVDRILDVIGLPDGKIKRWSNV